LEADPALLAYAKANALAPYGATAALTTDDWPYFYQHEPGLPSAVILMSIVLVGLGWFLLRDTGVPVGSLDWHFFFLGAGFFLLEAQIISKMALLFGTTWLVNSIAISGLLLLIVASNVLVEYTKNFNIGFAYAGIFISMIVSYATPMRSLFFASGRLLRCLACRYFSPAFCLSGASRRPAFKVRRWDRTSSAPW
jgi:hypothetical protein